MKSKTHRLEAIRSFVAGGSISSQEELMQMLAAQGYSVTQATLSRDLRELGIYKAHDAVEGGYTYRLPNPGPAPALGASGPIGRDGVRSISFGTGIAVIKTYPGLASAVALLIDSRVHDVLLGTIAGDDTVLAALRPGCSRADVLESLERQFPGVGSKVL